MSEMLVIEQRPSGSGAVPWILDEEGRRTEGYDDDRRIAAVQAGLSRHPHVHTSPAEASAEDVEVVLHGLHESDYIAALRSVSGREAVMLPELAEPGLAPDTPVCAAAIATAEQGVATAISAASLVLQGAWFTYALCRPPGHHAGPSWLGGYCYYNNAAAAALTLCEGGIRRVGILDLDIHYPNGTAALIADMSGTVLHSLQGCTGANLPWQRVRPRTDREHLVSFRTAPDDEDYLEAVSRSIAKIASESDAVVLSLGYDIVAGDPHGTWSFEPSIFRRIGSLLAGSALPVCVVQEGGYAYEQLAACGEEFANGLLSGGEQ